MSPTLTVFKVYNSRYYCWACSAVDFMWKRGIWVIKYSNILAILSYFWLIILIVRHCTAYGCSNWSNKVGWENLSWHKHRFCYMARAGTTEHLNMFFGWRYVSPYYLLEFTTFAVDHDPNASLSCAFTSKPLNCRLNHNNCYCDFHCCKVEYLATLWSSLTKSLPICIQAENYGEKKQSKMTMKNVKRSSQDTNENKKERNSQTFSFNNEEQKSISICLKFFRPGPSWSSISRR